MDAYESWAYDSWEVERWDTPVSDLAGLVLVGLVDHRGLHLILEEARSSARARWAMRFDHYPAYRNVPEEYRSALWDHLDQSKQRCGCTFVVTNSPWITSLRRSEGVFAASETSLQHFVVATEDDVVEILSDKEPQMHRIAPAPRNAEVAGKSTVLYDPDDRPAIDELLRRIGLEPKTQ
jgi:hypothetical protein